MPTITLPKNLPPTTDLIAVPRTVYEEFLAWQREVKSKNIYHPTVAEKRMIVQARKRFAEGKYVTLEELRNDLERRR